MFVVLITCVIVVDKGSNRIVLMLRGTFVLHQNKKDATSHLSTMDVFEKDWEYSN